jgi:AcrR family transcriptional regulator
VPERSAVHAGGEAPRSTKDRILEAAEAIFAQRGFEGASTREIAARAGVNISSLHYHWASKETLYLAVFRDVFARITHHLDAAVAPLVTPGPDGRGDLVDGVMRELFDFFAARPNVPRLLVRRIVETEAFDERLEEDVLAPAWRHFAAWTQRARLDDRAARLFMLSVHSVLMVYLLDSGPYRAVLGGSLTDPPLRDAVRRHVADLAHALLARMAG